MLLLVALCIIGSSVLTFAQKDGDLRLISKRLEIFYNRTWGTVCNDDFDDTDALVACKQLGFNGGKSLDSKINDGTGQIWLDNIGCKGNELALANCPRSGWGVHNCDHSEDVGIECFNTYASDGDLRLISKRLEVFYNGIWGTVCNDGFDDIDAQVACKQFGYSGGKSLDSKVDDGTGQIWLENVGCKGNELTLANCPGSGWGMHDCDHEEDVGIECFNTYDGLIYLSNGVLNIFYNKTRGTVCDDSFDNVDAQVACRQLGYNNGRYVGSTVTSENIKIWLDNVDCNGDETTLADCPNAGWGVNDCSHGESVMIACNNNSEGDVRLSSGKLEILHNNEWGTVCSANFDNMTANVACKQLGLRNGSVLQDTVATGTSRIWLNKLRCNGQETKLIDCSHTEWGIHTCSHGNVVGIRCEGNGDVRINSGRLEVYYNESWGTVCDDEFDERDATVACKQLGYNNGKFLDSNGNGTGNTWLDDLECTGNEPTLGDCKNGGWGVENCGHTEDVRVECEHSNEDDLRINKNRLQIFHNNEWGSVCSEDFNHSDALVACRQLGYRNGYASGEASYGIGKIWLAEVSCMGGEGTLTSCTHAEWGKNDCKQIVEITCHNAGLGWECSSECSTQWACKYIVQIVAGGAAGCILTTIVFVLVCQYVASRIRTNHQDRSYSATLKTDKPTREYDGVVAFNKLSNDAIVQDEIYDIVE